MIGVKGTIKSKTDINKLFCVGRKITTKNVIALVTESLDERDQEGRVAFIAGKRLGNAPTRNRAKRVLREAARALRAPWRGFDVVFIAREATATASAENVLKDLVTIAEKARLL